MLMGARRFWPENSPEILDQGKTALYRMFQRETARSLYPALFFGNGEEQEKEESLYDWYIQCVLAMR